MSSPLAPSPSAGAAPARPWFLSALLMLWAAFAAYCASGFPPAVDLAAHGAQLQTLADWLRGEPAVREVYGVHFPWGYGLVYWLFLPLALATNGAVAVRCALWLALVLFPLSHLALVRASRRSEGVLLVGLPLAFNLSYWYGLLSGLFAQPLAFFTLALFVLALDSPRPGRLLWVNLAAAATFQAHLVAFAAISVAMAAVTLWRRPLLPALRTLVLCMALPALLALPKVWSMATRAVVPGPWPATEYNLLSHFNWFFRTYRPEGLLAVAAPLLATLVFVGCWARRRREEPRAPVLAFLSLVALYFLTPKTLSGSFLVSVRLPVLAAMCSLVLVDWRALARPLRALLVLLSLASLAETAAFHARFAHEVDGLEEVMAGAAPGRHGYLSLVGDRVLGSKHIYLAHLGQWLTATRGGVGHNFFADAEHHPVHALPGRELPTALDTATPEELNRFDTVLVFGPGAQPLPPRLSGWHEAARAGPWRLLERR
ncbi:hypothetical protein [Archangium sp.]|uniref:hypothetical protein n=1 Tax=Archangium sp. TaxID=1872627 RepID=UPI002D46CE0F|nr:hypothetical protein [Archangium sp.]HYO55541.1 hypothetical protein [Archangium sp.]